MKRTINNNMAEQEKRMHKTIFTDSAQTLKNQLIHDPARLALSAHLIKVLAEPASDSQAGTMVSKWHGTISKLPKSTKKKLILEKLPHLQEHWLQLWTITEKGFLEHLFEFEFFIGPEFAWPQGACHRQGMMEKVVEHWRTHLLNKHSPQKRLEDVSQAEFGSQPAFKWNLHGVYMFIPEDADEKTHILHKLSKETAAIPSSMQVDNTWTIEKNWSDHQAVLVDTDNYPIREISTFFHLAGVGMTMGDWVNFANAKAAALAMEEDRPQNAVQGALAVVMNHHGSASSAAD